MYNLLKKDANSLIELIHESLNCDTLNAFHRLVQKLKLLTADDGGIDLSYSAEDHAGYLSLDISGTFPQGDDLRKESSIPLCPLPDGGGSMAGQRTVRSERLPAATQRGLIFPGKNSAGSRSRTEVILNHALPHLRQALARATKDEEHSKQRRSLGGRRKCCSG